jgi:hypothetical protein
MKMRENAVWIVMALFFVSFPTTLILYINHLLPTTASGAPYLMIVPFLLVPVMIALAFGSNVRTFFVNRSLRERGMAMSGTLLKSQQTGTFINRTPVMRLTVKLATGEIVELEHLYRFGSLLAEGMPLSLIVDPHDHRRAMIA